MRVGWFLFDNATSHSVYAGNALIAKNMNKGEGGEQPLLRNGWYHDDNRVVIQEMFYMLLREPLFKYLHKGIQKVLEERKLWPSKGMLLECPRQRCSKEPCQNSLRCKACIKGSRCQSCREKKVHSGNCTPKRIRDSCYRRKERCRCVQKKTCESCKKRQREGCKDCDALPPKCNSESQFSSSYPLSY